MMSAFLLQVLFCVTLTFGRNDTTDAVQDVVNHKECHRLQSFFPNYKRTLRSGAHNFVAVKNLVLL